MAAILADDISKCLFLYENDIIPILISLKCVPGSQSDNRLALVEVMAWRWTGHKPLHELMLTQLTRKYAPLEGDDLMSPNLYDFIKISSMKNLNGTEWTNYSAQ